MTNNSPTPNGSMVCDARISPDAFNARSSSRYQPPAGTVNFAENSESVCSTVKGNQGLSTTLVCDEFAESAVGCGKVAGTKRDSHLAGVATLDLPRITSVA